MKMPQEMVYGGKRFKGKVRSMALKGVEVPGQWDLPITHTLGPPYSRHIGASL